MTPEERQLISDLFDRMRDHGAPDKDRQAEALINQSLRANPDAGYMLVQSVLVHEQALQAANARVLELEDQLREMQGDEPPRGSKSGGFLGGYWGDRRGEQPRSSVPQVGARATPSAYDREPGYDRDRGSPWSRGAPEPQPQQAPPQASGGGFMKSALATAAGVAGGMVLADSIRGMLGGGAHASPSLSGPREGGAEAAGERYVDARDNDPGTYERDDNDPGSDDNDPGVDSGGDGEIEI
jgi:hypothetical protein